MVVSVDELEEPGPAVQDQKQKAAGLAPTMTKWVRIANGLVDMEEELEHASCLLEAVQDEAVAVSEQVQAVNVHLQDLDSWVQDLRKQVKAGRK